MNELGLEIDEVMPWFVIGADQGYTRVTVSAEHAGSWADLLSTPYDVVTFQTHDWQLLQPRGTLHKGRLCRHYFRTPAP